MFPRMLFVVAIGLLVVSVILRGYYHSTSYQDQHLRNKTSLGNYPPGTRVAVIGGGISGLSFTRHIQNKHRVDLVEKRDVYGGNNYSGDHRIPLRFGVFLQRSSPCLTRLIQELGLGVETPRTGKVIPSYNGQFKRRTTWRDFTFVSKVYLPCFYRYVLSQYYNDNNTGDSFPADDYIFNYYTTVIGGINMFTDAQDFKSLPAGQTAEYIYRCSFDKFKCVKGGNHRLITKLVDSLQKNPSVQLQNGRRVKSIYPTDGKVSVDNKLYESVVICCQPHNVRKIIPKDLEPHQSICKCFTTVKCFSCLHKFTRMFQDLPSDTNLSYETIGKHHYLHIDIAYYKLPNLEKSREMVVSYWYDDAPNIIPQKYILERSITTMSRQIASRKTQLRSLLMDLKKNHQNIHLCNAAYYGFMWHEDACAISKSVSGAYV